MAVMLALLVCAGDGLVDQAVAAIDRFEYDRALELLERALAEAPPRARARIHVHLGVVRFTLGDRAAAERELHAALALDRAAVLPVDTSPKIVARFEQLRAALPPPPPPVAAPPPAPPVRIAEPAGDPQRLWTWLAVGVGGATVATGVVFAVLSSSAEADARDARWADDAAAANDRARTLGDTATGLFIGGGVLLAGTVALFFLEGSTSATVVPAGDGVAVGWVGRF